jgi:hypothetical protein
MPPAANVHRVDWKTKKGLMMAIIACDGYIFGGAVRDWHLHEDGATTFYKAHQDTPNSAEDMDVLYNDVDYMPECAHRMVIPVDIDACIHASDLPRLLDVFKEKRFYMTRLFTHDPVAYIPGIKLKKDEVRHMRFKVDILPRIGSLFADALFTELDPMVTAFVATLKEATRGLQPFMLDLLVVNVPKDKMQPEAPFGSLDFECNGLLASKQGIHLSKHLCEGICLNPMTYDRDYRRIMDDILKKKAVLAIGENRHQIARIGKMVDKGWTIAGFRCVEYLKTLGDEEREGHCIICHGELGAHHYKMTCCNGRYHMKCLVQGMTVGVSAMKHSGKCLMCKRHLWEPDHDVHVLESIMAANDVREGGDEA